MMKIAYWRRIESFCWIRGSPTDQLQSYQTSFQRLLAASDELARFFLEDEDGHPKDVQSRSDRKVESNDDHYKSDQIVDLFVLTRVKNTVLKGRIDSGFAASTQTQLPQWSSLSEQ